MGVKTIMKTVTGFLAIAAFSVFTQTRGNSAVPPDTEIYNILASRVGPDNQGVGLVVGIIDPRGRRVIAYGSLAKNDKRPLNGDTVFEIGSMTKVFTSLVLMDMVQKGEVTVNDPVSKYLPASVKVPERNGRKITLQDLATQSSGLPRMPNNFKPKDESNPYADYTPERLYEFLSSYVLTRDIGGQFEYSNLGVGLLGQALSLRAGMDYETLVKSRVLEPLEMKSTGITLSPEMKARLAFGHGPNLDIVPNWDIAVLAGAGGLRSSANDMLTFLAANLGYVKTPLASAMAAEVSIRRPAGAPDMKIAYNWFIQTKDGNSIFWHNGGTGGYRTYMGFDPKSRTGVVVLSNLSSPAGPDDIGRHLLDASYPLQQVAPPEAHKQISVDSKVIDKYLGSYQLAPNVLITMTRDGDQLVAQLTGQPKIPVFPEGEGKFFLKVVDAQLRFDTDAQGRVTQVVLHQGGRDQPAIRLNAAGLKQAADDAAIVAQRFKDQKQAPGAQAAIRTVFEGLRTGQPNYDSMTAAMADVTRQQLTQLRSTTSQLGVVQSVTFKSVGPGGMDIFEVKFEHGSMEIRIALDAEGKVAGMNFRPM